jgi:hypothetical protein
MAQYSLGLWVALSTWLLEPFKLFDVIFAHT